jgi:hypothetical protein
MSKSEEDIRSYEEGLAKHGQFVRILNFPEIVLANINATLSANNLRELADFLDEVEDGRE